MNMPQPAPAEVDKPHPFHMSSYVGPQPRCWCDRYADHPVHRAPLPEVSP